MALVGNVDIVVVGQIEGADHPQVGPFGGGAPLRLAHFFPVQAPLAVGIGDGERGDLDIEERQVGHAGVAADGVDEVEEVVFESVGDARLGIALALIPDDPLDPSADHLDALDHRAVERAAPFGALVGAPLGHRRAAVGAGDEADGAVESARQFAAEEETRPDAAQRLLAALGGQSGEFLVAFIEQNAVDGRDGFKNPVVGQRRRHPAVIHVEHEEARIAGRLVFEEPGPLHVGLPREDPQIALFARRKGHRVVGRR
ncbi:MAG: hypothetical protein BWZ08_02844 [candidate division BRC1 bacterium ADurb.BinA292]|nr:MAG: hypothetical protein BWZ08_02844 [candidate division BRC1 bacterium ADurb.BinA292]